MARRQWSVPQADADAWVIRPHDLLWVDDMAALTADEPLPPWVTHDWLESAPVVVRRERVKDARSIPVGVRGKTRSERFAGYVGRGAIAGCVRPESLARAAHRRFRGIPAIAALAALAPSLDATRLAWGPTGGVGFAIASGLPVLRPDSDLDLVVRSPAPFSAEQAELLLTLGSPSGCRIDIQIDTGHGAFSLEEWARSRRRVLLKTDTGPVLTDDPWRPCPRR